MNLHKGDKEARLKERFNSDFLKRNHEDKKLIIVRWKVKEREEGYPVWSTVSSGP